MRPPSRAPYPPVHADPALAALQNAAYRPTIADLRAVWSWYNRIIFKTPLSGERNWIQFRWNPPHKYGYLVDLEFGEIRIPIFWFDDVDASRKRRNIDDEKRPRRTILRNDSTRNLTRYRTFRFPIRYTYFSRSYVLIYKDVHVRLLERRDLRKTADLDDLIIVRRYPRSLHIYEKYRILDFIRFKCAYGLVSYTS